MNNTPSPAPSEECAPVFVNSRREALWIFRVWAVGLVWAVPYCYFTGYDESVDAATFSTTLGIPTWLFWGILVPWIVADIFTIWFCFCYMQDDDLGGEPETASATAETNSDAKGDPS